MKIMPQSSSIDIVTISRHINIPNLLLFSWLLKNNANLQLIRSKWRMYIYILISAGNYFYSSHEAEILKSETFNVINILFEDHAMAK